MDLQLQSLFNKIQTEISSNAKSWIPTPSKLNVESILSAIVVMIGFWVASIIVQHITERFFAVRKIDESLARFLQRVVKFALLVLGFVTALGTLGVDVSAIVAGLGLTGLALGIALKDIVSNAVSGIMLLIFRPFRHRDLIKVADFEGEVIDIDMRYTHLRTEEKVIFVPNSLLFANAVTVTKSGAIKAHPQPTETAQTAPKPAKPRKATLLTLVADDSDSAAA